jgi:hypothetical protein
MSADAPETPRDGEYLPTSAEAALQFQSLRVLRFAEEYVRCGNMQEAARRAGFTGSEPQLRRCAQRLLAREDVGNYVVAHLRSIVSPAEAGAILSSIIRGSMGFFIDITEEGTPVLNLNKPEAQANLHLIKRLKPTKLGFEIELCDKMPALALYAKYAPPLDQRAMQRRAVEELLQALPPKLRDEAREALCQDHGANLQVSEGPDGGDMASAAAEVDLSWLRPEEEAAAATTTTPTPTVAPAPEVEDEPESW